MGKWKRKMIKGSGRKNGVDNESIRVKGTMRKRGEGIHD